MARRRWFRWSVFIVLLLVVAAGAPMIRALLTLPSINDITTDVDDPPAFETLGGSAYPPAFADQQRAAYPDLGPLTLPLAPASAFEEALAVARDLGWSIAADDATDGTIEAVAVTPMLRFKDDVAIRVRAEGDGVRIDIRSRSRLGRHDLGANAERIRTFLDRLRP